MRGALALVAVLATGAAARADVDYPARPGPREFVADEAGLLDAAARQRVVAIADRCLSDTGVPVVVVTLRSLADHGAAGLSIDAYARDLFDTWEIGHRERNLGVLLLVSAGDRKARIELGAEWGGGKHARAQSIMDTIVVPRFRQGAFAEGIEAGVAALDAMVRNVSVPSRYRSPVSGTSVLLWLAFAGLAVFTAVSLSRRGSSGWAWLFWGAVFVSLFFVLRALAESRGRRGFGGGSFGGGSFGGGFSGGGGATGSW
jgi:uncharacterized protein